MRAKVDVAAEVAALADLPREELVERWSKIYGVPAPKGVRQELLARAVAWHLQAKRLGGYSAEMRRLLRSAMNKAESEMLARGGCGDNAPDGKAKATDSDIDLAEGEVTSCSLTTRERRMLSPGARLLREWGGRTHVVDVIEGGYVFEAKVYPSLTAIAGQITGGHRSGPRFFGI